MKYIAPIAVAGIDKASNARRLRKGVKSIKLSYGFIKEYMYIPTFWPPELDLVPNTVIFRLAIPSLLVERR